jgi:pyruvate kinase
MSMPGSTSEFIRAVDATLRETGWASVGDPLVVVVGEPIGQADYTNSIRIHTVRES